MKILFSTHAKEMMGKRGATQKEIKETILKGEWHKAKKLDRFESSLEFPYQKEWNGNFYQFKQVNPVFVKEDEMITVVTVYVFYLNR